MLLWAARPASLTYADARAAGSVDHPPCLACGPCLTDDVGLSADGRTLIIICVRPFCWLNLLSAHTAHPARACWFVPGCVSLMLSVVDLSEWYHSTSKSGVKMPVRCCINLQLCGRNVASCFMHPTSQIQTFATRTLTKLRLNLQYGHSRKFERVVWVSWWQRVHFQWFCGKPCCCK